MGPFMQPSLRPGTIGIVPDQQPHTHNTNAYAGRLPRILSSPIRHIIENGARGRRRWWRWWRRDLDKHWQAYLWHGRPESRDIRPQPVQRLLYVGHSSPGRVKREVNVVLDGFEILLDVFGHNVRREREAQSRIYIRVGTKLKSNTNRNTCQSHRPRRVSHIPGSPQTHATRTARQPHHKTPT